jgi:photosystem II stability/assembly factor-like uncharacterized protein
MRRRTLFLSPIFISIALLVLGMLALGCVRDGRGSQQLIGSDLDIEVIVNEPVLTPLYDGECKDAWERIPTDRGPDAYLTLNVNNSIFSTNSGKWTPNLPQNGFYRVEAYIPDHPPIEWCTTNIGLVYTDTAEARYEIHHASGVTIQTASQRPLANQWLDLGLFPFKAGATGYVRLADLNSEENLTYTVSFSAMRFTYTGAANARYLPIVSDSKPTATPSPGVAVSQKAGFDACTLPSISKMQTWWNESPYWIYGLYLGGISYPAPPSCSLADAAWVSAVRQQGWTFIPTWVGPQASCSAFKNKMNSDPVAAYQQGRSEAEAAVAAAARVGLINASHGTVIYYDLENFGGASDECRQTASSFINGWTERLHELGQRAGGYGSGCSSYVRDWATISNVPDDIWAASWYTDNYDPAASVFGVLCLDNKLWANHQRIRQYAGGHNETWGGQTHNIDSNIADGEVAVPGVSAAAASQVEAFSQPVIKDMGWFSAEQGWLLEGDRLLWTADGGSTWQERTPVEKPVPSLAASVFNSESEGWAVSFPIRAGEYLLYHTTDRGSTWQVQSLQLPAGDWQPLQVGSIDSANLWVAYRQVTSILFSRGALLKSTDGGVSWNVYDVPIGEPIFFDTTQSGWTAGGAAGNELFTTADGGLTWQAQALKAADLPVETILAPEEKAAAGLPGQVMRLEYSDAQTGWAVVVQGDCQGEKGSPETACRQVSTLWKTGDGGKTWQPVALPTEP